MTLDARGARAGIERIATGIGPLDQILCGGIPQYSIVFVAGPPGTGKTVLCQQMLFASAQTSQRVLYLSTLSEPVLKMIRFVQEFSFFKPAMVGKEVVYGDLGSALIRNEGGAGVLAQIEELIAHHRPDFLVIDSFKVLREFFGEVAPFREFCSALMVRLTAWEVTSVFVGEYAHDDIWEQPEFSIADGIIFLYGTEEPRRQKRFLRVMKMRGTDYFSGQHYFEISSDGIDLYPRMDPRDIGEYQAPPERVGSVIDGLNVMMGGGIQNGTSALIVGGAGTGKTLAAMSFLVEGAREGKPGLFVSFEESAQQLVRNCEPFGWDLGGLMKRGLLDVYHVAPSELDVDRHAVVIKQRAAAIRAHRIVLDTITAIEASVLDRGKYQAHLWTIIDYFKRIGATIVMTHESAAQAELIKGGENHLSFLADTILSMQLVEVDSTLQQTLTVLKMRGGAHDKSIRQYIIDPPRIAVGDVFRNGSRGAGSRGAGLSI